MKKVSVFFMLSLASAGFYAQTTNYSTGGNATSSVAVFGTTNNQPINFITNNTLKMVLGTNGVLTVNTLTGSGNRFLKVDAGGSLVSFANGSATDVLYGNGTWGSLPNSVSAFTMVDNAIYTSSNASLGIGTSNPQYPLDVAGNANFSGILKSAPLGNGTGYQPVFVGPTGVLTTLSNAGGVNPSTSCNPLNPSWQIGGNTIFGSGLTDISAGTCDDYTFGLKSNNVVKIWLTGTNYNGNIGFGTSAPTERFHFTGGNILLDDVNAPTNQLRMRIKAANNTGLSVETVQLNDFGYNTKLYVNKELTKALGIFNTANGTPKETFKVYGNGKTQIGDLVQFGQNSHFDAMLSVDGKIVAKSCYITLSNWADYVFDTDYKVADLYETEKYYLKYKHLPEVPNEKEILENGVNLAEMNRILLKKVEEMTIILVKQQKEIDLLKEKVK